MHGVRVNIRVCGEEVHIQLWLADHASDTLSYSHSGNMAADADNRHAREER